MIVNLPHERLGDGGMVESGAVNSIRQVASEKRNYVIMELIEGESRDVCDINFLDLSLTCAWKRRPEAHLSSFLRCKLSLYYAVPRPCSVGVLNGKNPRREKKKQRTEFHCL
jgi:hypothetical protein